MYGYGPCVKGATVRAALALVGEKRRCMGGSVGSRGLVEARFEIGFCATSLGKGRSEARGAAEAGAADRPAEACRPTGAAPVLVGA